LTHIFYFPGLWHSQIMAKKPKRPKDPNQLGKLIADIAVGNTKDVDYDSGKDPAAVALGRKGGLKGGKARANALTSEQRKEIAKKAAKTRWDKDD
jgi:hypothetical protein